MKRASAKEALWVLGEDAQASLGNILQKNVWNQLPGHTIQGPFQDLMRALTLDRIVKQASFIDPTRGRVAAWLPKQFLFPSIDQLTGNQIPRSWVVVFDNRPFRRIETSDGRRLKTSIIRGPYPGDHRFVPPPSAFEGNVFELVIQSIHASLGGADHGLQHRHLAGRKLMVGDVVSFIDPSISKQAPIVGEISEFIPEGLVNLERVRDVGILPTTPFTRLEVHGSHLKPSENKGRPIRSGNLELQLPMTVKRAIVIGRGNGLHKGVQPVRRDDFLLPGPHAPFNKGLVSQPSFRNEGRLPQTAFLMMVGHRY